MVMETSNNGISNVCYKTISFVDDIAPLGSNVEEQQNALNKIRSTMNYRLSCMGRTVKLIKSQRLRWLRHVERMSEDKMPKRMLREHYILSLIHI